MAETEEPPIKKLKMSINIDDFIKNVIESKINLLPIMSEDLIKPIPLIKCYAGHIKDPKQLSKAIQILNEKLPLKDLHHLKRVFKHSVLLCPVDYLSQFNNISMHEFIEQHIPELKDLYEFFKDVEVPATAPLTKKQIMHCNKKWTCNFHPNKYIEKMVSNTCFSTQELGLHRMYMGMALEIARLYLLKKECSPTMQDLVSVNAAIVVDPTTASVVAIAFDNRKENPVQHAAMVAIDNVAKTQNGGVWVTNEDTTKDLNWKLRTKFHTVKFGARKYVSKKDATENDKVDDSPYLCTGYDIYLTREPCVMCAMGLVHARIRRIFYTFKNHDQGAVQTKTKLHCVPGLNHRFEVFTGFEVYNELIDT